MKQRLRKKKEKQRQENNWKQLLSGEVMPLYKNIIKCLIEKIKDETPSRNIVIINPKYHDLLEKIEKIENLIYFGIVK
jgi:hypothetical protein